MATPHGGSSYARVLNPLLKAFLSPKKFVEEMLPGCKFLETLQKDFKGLATSFQIVNYYETKGMGLLRVLCVDFLADCQRPIADYGNDKLWPNMTSSYLPGNHTKITRYATKSDPNFQVVSNRLRIMIMYGFLRFRVQPVRDSALLENSDALVIWVGDVQDEIDEPGLTRAKELNLRVEKFHSITDAMGWVDENIGSFGSLISGLTRCRYASR